MTPSPQPETQAPIVPSFYQLACDIVRMPTPALEAMLANNQRNKTMTLTIKNTARQGDVMLVRVDALPEGLIETKRDTAGRIVLAHGEKSGHGHAIRQRHVQGFRLSTTMDDPTGVSGGVDYILVGGSGPATLSHEYISGQKAEHEPIDLPPGVYKVALQREYSPQGIQRVVD